MNELDVVKFRAAAELPANATPVRVTNVLSPYQIRICTAERYQEMVDAIAKELLFLLPKSGFKIGAISALPKLGDFVIVDGRCGEDVELPSWLCRGVICGTDLFRKNFKVLLTDYGTCVQLTRRGFTVLPKDPIKENPLSRTVGVYNLLPACGNQKSRKGNVNCCTVLEDWRQEATEFTKDLLSMSREVYFQCLATDELKREYGDFYLEIDGDVISLRQALLLGNHAIYLEDLLEFIRNPSTENCEKIEPRTEENVAVFHIDLSKAKTNKAKDFPLKINPQKTVKDTFESEEREKMQLENERQRVLLYGTSKIECLTSVHDAKFPIKVHEAWNSLVSSRRPTKIQCYLWPAIKKGHDVLAIGPPKCGKTFGYAVAICAALATIADLPRGNKPSSLVLCSSSTNVLNVHSVFTELLIGTENVKAVVAVNGKSDRSLAAEIFNGCQILISTPSFLVRFLQRNKKLLNFDHLRQLVLDDVDVLFQKYGLSIFELMREHPAIIRMFSKNRSNERPVQVILTGEHCTSFLRSSIDSLAASPIICITSFIEAAIFKSVVPKVYATDSKNKNKVLSSFLAEYRRTRTMVVCVNAEEAKDLNSFLENEETLLAHENMDLIALQDIKKRWNVNMTMSYPLLICTDQVLSELNVTNVDHLIHHSISLELKRPFNFRFSVLLENLRKEKSDCRVTVVADETNDLQFVSIVRIMERMKTNISTGTRQFLDRIDVALEKRKRDFPLCERLLSFGDCPTRSSCCLRHCVLSEVDQPRTKIEIGDTVKLVVMYVHDATHFSARVISYVKSESREVVEFPSEEYLKLPMKMHEYYSNVNNRKRSETVNVGGIYTLDDSISSFKRVEVIRARTEEKNVLTDTKHVDLRCIDSGVILKRVNANRLLEIPKELSELPTPVVEVFVTGIVPYDDECHWNRWTVDVVHEWFEENIDERSYVTGKVELHLRDVLLVDTLNIQTKIVGCDEIVGTSLKTELLSKELGIRSTHHVPHLYQLCQNGGIPVGL